jgi:hypothetical protein
MQRPAAAAAAALVTATLATTAAATPTAAVAAAVNTTRSTGGAPATVVAVVFQDGGLGDCGRHALLHALQRDDVSEVRAVSREPEKPAAPEPDFAGLLTPGERAKLRRVAVDPATDPDGMHRALDGAHVVIFGLGNRQPGFKRDGKWLLRNIANRSLYLSTQIAKSDVGLFMVNQALMPAAIGGGGMSSDGGGGGSGGGGGGRAAASTAPQPGARLSRQAVEIGLEWGTDVTAKPTQA